MNEEEIVSNNKLIAEFMGAKRSRVDGKGKWVHWHYSFRYKNLQYHSSWDWLMPVVEKIELMGHMVTICFSPIKADEEVDGKMIPAPNENRCMIIYPKTRGEMIDAMLGNIPDRASGVGNTKVEAVWLAVIEFIKFYNDQKSTNP